MRRFGNYIETDTGLSGYEPLVVLGRELEELSTVVLPHFWQQPRRGVRRLARVVAGNGAISVKWQLRLVVQQVSQSCAIAANTFGQALWPLGVSGEGRTPLMGAEVRFESAKPTNSAAEFRHPFFPLHREETQQ